MKRKLIHCLWLLALTTLPLAAAEQFTSPASPRATSNFNPGWPSFKGDVQHWQIAAP